MIIINYIFLFITLVSLNAKLYGATLKGIVTDSHTGEILIGANVIILGTEMRATTDINGFYIISDLSTGEYIIRTTFIPYQMRVDTISIKNQDDLIEFNIKLKLPIVFLDSVYIPQFESYHKKLEEKNKTKQVMLINIDSLTYSNNFLTAYLSMTNNADDSFYIFKNYSCFNIVHPIITDNTGKLFNRNMIMSDCFGQKICPDSTDLILIKIGETIKYPVTKLEFYNFHAIPKGEYSIKIKYEFSKPRIIDISCTRNIDLILTGLRGTYISSNEFIFINQ